MNSKECPDCIILKAMNEHLRARIEQLERQLEDGPVIGDIDGRD